MAAAPIGDRRPFFTNNPRVTSIVGTDRSPSGDLNAPAERPPRPACGISVVDVRRGDVSLFSFKKTNRNSLIAPFAAARNHRLGLESQLNHYFVATTVAGCGNAARGRWNVPIQAGCSLLPHRPRHPGEL